MSLLGIVSYKNGPLPCMKWSNGGGTWRLQSSLCTRPYDLVYHHSCLLGMARSKSPQFCVSRFVIVQLSTNRQTSSTEPWFFIRSHHWISKYGKALYILIDERGTSYPMSIIIYFSFVCIQASNKIFIFRNLNCKVKETLNAYWGRKQS